MKTRQGFVSNSSSSSFIVGIGHVVNLGKLRAYLAANNIKEDRFDVFTAKVHKLEGSKYAGYCMRVTDSRITVESFQSEASISRKGIGPSDTIVVVNIMNNEGDCGQFEYNEDTGTIDYDIDLDDFDEPQQKVYLMFNNPESGIDVKTSDVSYGAGRNG